MTDKRQFPRKKRRLTVEFNWNKSPCTGFTYDLSVSGIFVRSIRIPRLGTRLKIVLFLPNAKEVPLVGSVVRSFRVPSSLARTIPSGFCLRIVERPPEDYLQFLASI
jgi:PilZ domain